MAGVEKMYTRIEVARVLRLSLGAIANKIYSGELKAINVGIKGRNKRPAWRIPESSLNAYIASISTGVKK